MITGEALEIVLNMAKSMNARRIGMPTPWVGWDKEKEAIEEVEFLLSSFDDEDYDEDEYC